MKLTEEVIEEVKKDLVWLCNSFEHCDNCVMSNHKGDCQVEIGVVEKALKYILDNKPLTNGEKFQEIFGFPVFELHQLSMQEEGDWLDKIYEENVPKMD